MSEEISSNDKFTTDDTVQDDNIDNSDTITLREVIQEQNELEEQYAAVLGESDGTTCTYSKVFTFYYLLHVFYILLYISVFE